MRLSELYVGTKLEYHNRKLA